MIGENMAEETTIEIVIPEAENSPETIAAPDVVVDSVGSDEIDRFVAIEARFAEIEARFISVENRAGDAEMSAANAQNTAETVVADAALAAMEAAEVATEPEPEPEPETHSEPDEAPNREHWFFADHPIKRG